jgi:hypothetical protein
LVANPKAQSSTDAQQQQRQQQQQSNGPFKPRIGQRPLVQPPEGQPPVAGFRPSQNLLVHSLPPLDLWLILKSYSQGNPVQIMANPNRGRGWHINGRGPPSPTRQKQEPVSPEAQDGPSTMEHEDERSDNATNGASVPNYKRRGGSRGYAPRGLGLRGAVPFPNAFVGRGGAGYRGGRGGPPPPGGLRGGYRGRGRGSPALTISHT